MTAILPQGIGNIDEPMDFRPLWLLLLSTTYIHVGVRGNDTWRQFEYLQISLDSRFGSMRRSTAFADAGVRRYNVDDYSSFPRRRESSQTMRF